MFKLLLIVTVLATGQASSPMEHVNSPFPTREACFAAAAESDAQVLKVFSEAAGGPVSSSYQCQPVERSADAADRGADEIARILRLMNSQGGIAAAGR